MTNRNKIVCKAAENFKKGLEAIQTFLGLFSSDDSWVYGFDSQTKQQSSQWKSPSTPHPKKAQQMKSNVKSILICYGNIEGIVRMEFVSPGQSVSAWF